MIRIEPVVLVEVAEEIAFADKGRRADDSMAEESVFACRIRKLYHVDSALTDGRLYFFRCVGFVDDDQMLDVSVALICNAFDRAHNAGIAGCGRDNRDKGIGAHSKSLFSERLLAGAVSYTQHHGDAILASHFSHVSCYD